MAPSTIFISLHFLHNLLICPVGYSIILHLARKANDEQSSLFGPFVSNDEN